MVSGRGPGGRAMPPALILGAELPAGPRARAASSGPAAARCSSATSRMPAPPPRRCWSRVLETGSYARLGPCDAGRRRAPASWPRCGPPRSADPAAQRRAGRPAGAPRRAAHRGRRRCAITPRTSPSCCATRWKTSPTGSAWHTGASASPRRTGCAITPGPATCASSPAW